MGGLKPPPPAPPSARSLKTQLFLYGYGFRPHVSDENDQWKRNFLKTLFSRVRVDRRKQGKTSTWITQISNKNKNLSKLSESLCSLFFNSSISLRKAWLEHTKHACRAQCTRVIIHHHHDHHNSIVLPPHPPPAYCFYCIRNTKKEKIMRIRRYFSWVMDKRLWRHRFNVFHHTLIRLHRKKTIIWAPYDSFYYKVVEQSIVNWVEWLWNPSDAFVICFCGPESAQRSKEFLSFWLYWPIKTLH